MQSLSAFSNITNIADFWWENAHDSKTQGVCNVIYIVFWIFFRNDILEILAVKARPRFIS